MTVLAADPRIVSLVARIATRHCGAGVDINELIGAGMLAACQAAERFDSGKGSLTALLRPRIHGAIIDAARRDCSPILTPRGCPPKRTVGDSQRDGQGDGQLSLADLVSDHRGDLRPDVGMMVDALPEEQAEILRTRYGFDGLPLSLEATAEALGRTTADVERLEASALAVLRQRLADLDYPRPVFDEEQTMSRLNGFHAAEPTTATAEPTDDKTCPSCNRRFKNLKVARCYYRDCVASGYGATSATTKGKEAKASTRKTAPVDRPTASVATPVSVPGPTRSLADEIQIMSLMAGLSPGGRQRVLAWAQSAFGV